MKRVITFVEPLPDQLVGNLPQLDAEEQNRVESSHEIRPADSPAIQTGARRIEVIVSDEKAVAILQTVLSQGANERSSSADYEEGDFDAIIQQELDAERPASGNLLDRVLSRIERQLISQVYAECDHVKSRAAVRLGINRNTLLKKLRQIEEIKPHAPDEVVTESPEETSPTETT